MINYDFDRGVNVSTEAGKFKKLASSKMMWVCTTGQITFFLLNVKIRYWNFGLSLLGTDDTPDE